MDHLQAPFIFEELTEKEKILFKGLEDILTEQERDCVRVLPCNYVVPRPVIECGVEIYNFKPKPEDVWIVGFPRSGTTLMQEILFILGTNFDYEKAASQIMDLRFPYLEHVYHLEKKEVDLFKALSQQKNLSTDEEYSLPGHIRLAKAKGRRFIKSHLGFTMLHPQLLEVGCKVVFMVRNFKDTFLSNFFYPRWTIRNEELQEKLRKMWLIFKNEMTNTGNYFKMLEEAWERRNNPNLLILFYEEVNKDKSTAIKKVADFMNVQISEEQLEKLVDHVDIKNFKKNSSVNNDHLVNMGLYVKNDERSFIRKGESGSWKNTLPPDMNSEMNEWIRYNLRKISGFTMPQCWKEAMDLDL